MSDVMWCGVIAATMFGGVLLVAVVTKMREVRKAALWTSTPGKVITSKVQARKDREEGSVEVRNYPLVEYEYEVAGQTYTGKRVSIGEQTGDDEVAEILAKYPEGAGVLVYYDSQDPEQAVLERDLPPGLGKGLAILGLFFIGGPIGLALAFGTLPAKLAPHLPNPHRAPMVLVLICMGLFAALMGYALRKQARAARHWPAAEGLVLSSRAEPRRSRTKHGATLTVYCPNVVYAYEVKGRRYAGSRVASNAITGTSNPRGAEATVARYTQGAPVRVYYNPKNAAESVLEHAAGRFPIVWIIVAVLWAVAYVIATKQV